MSLVGHQRRLKRLAAISAVTLNADIRPRCDIRRNGPLGDISPSDRNEWPRCSGRNRITP
jgi:hypothetical protein